MHPRSWLVTMVCIAEAGRLQDLLRAHGAQLRYIGLGPPISWAEVSGKVAFSKPCWRCDGEELRDQPFRAHSCAMSARKISHWQDSVDQWGSRCRVPFGAEYRGVQSGSQVQGRLYQWIRLNKCEQRYFEKQYHFEDLSVQVTWFVSLEEKAGMVLAEWLRGRN